ncbi:hypothetical protein ECANGB1_2681 [Enterospora canceri]|uniref:Uncharacterized protein n=1 Tax=Enterospora canceri TaxID=1081671 RepID=A0A1Y1S9M4_9MICR|nr:hypothetical protein ECANGB1_2681 [Enterospora canceri]
MLNPLGTLFVLNATNITASTPGCTDDEATYIVNFRAHIQRDIQEALVSVNSKTKGSGLTNEYIAQDGESAAMAASKSYLGTVLEELNMELFPFKVQANLVLDPLELDQVGNMGSADPSCEIGDALKSRTQLAYNSLVDKFGDFVGIHFFIFSCIVAKDAYSPVHVIEKDTCGRVVGVMWNGTDDTKGVLKSAIMQAMTGIPNMFANGKMGLADKSPMCVFTEGCISTVTSALGQLVPGHLHVTFTKKPKDAVKSLAGKVGSVADALNPIKAFSRSRG